MKFLNGAIPDYDLTYSDVCIVPSLTESASRMEVSTETSDGVGHLPVVVANMTAVAGRRMAETVARRGGIVVIPQDIPIEVVAEIINSVGFAHLLYDTPLTLGPDNTVNEALELIHKRAHGAIIVVDGANRPVGIFTEIDAQGQDRFSKLEQVMAHQVVSLNDGQSIAQMYEFLEVNRLSVAPVVDSSGTLIGVMTPKTCLRTELYAPNLGVNGRLRVAAAVGINGDVAGKVQQLLELGVEILVIDTAHGHQSKMIEALQQTRSVIGSRPITVVAGNVATAQATRDLIAAGADIVKVGIGPGAMCTTRVMTGVGRPQFSAVLECATEARKHGKHVWADGGIRYPRDVALAIAAGASNVMFASWLAGTYESAADMMHDEKGRLYKESFGMASRRAVRNRNAKESTLDIAMKELFEEGISTSRFYLKDATPGVEDIIDQIVAGLRSACTYTGATNLEEFHEHAIIGVQSAAGYNEGLPVSNGW
jgi:IMP dehydrogenase